MTKTLVEIIPMNISIDNKEVADLYNTADKLMLIVQAMGYNPVMGDPVTAFGLPGTAASAYQQARMVSFYLDSTTLCTMGFNCYSYVNQDSTTKQWKWNTSSSYKYGVLDIMISIMTYEGNQWSNVRTGYGYVGNGDDYSYTNKYGIRHVYIYNGENSKILNFRTLDAGGSRVYYGQHWNGEKIVYDSYGSHVAIFTYYMSGSSKRYILQYFQDKFFNCTMTYPNIIEQYKKYNSVLAKGTISNDDATVTDAINSFKLYESSEYMYGLQYDGICIINNVEYFISWTSNSGNLYTYATRM